MSAATATGRTLAMGENEAGSAGSNVVEAPFGKAMVQLGAVRPDVVGLTADLGKYTDITPFREAYPDRFFNVGMAEQNLVAVAAGLSRTGLVPFATTYGVFASRRAYDFIAIAVAHSRLNVKIIAGMPGLTTGYGGTHQAIEDLALMRMIPDLVVIDPCDAIDIQAATHAIADYDGPVYMRLLRGAVPVSLAADYRFEIGKAHLLREGRDIGVVSTGMMTTNALEAADRLNAQGISVGILHVPTIKPFDTAAVVDFAAAFPRLVTAENHVVVGGLGSLVVEALHETSVQVPVTRIGLPDRYIPCGSVPTLQARYGITANAMVQSIRRLVAGGP